jgi:dihydroorotate dehydrogenase (fumarate)
MESLQLGSMELTTPFLAASSYASSRLRDLRQLNRSAVGAIITKSATLEARAGNPDPNYFSEGQLTTNAQGLPGPDLDGTMQMLEKFQPEKLKPVILSIAGLKPTEYFEIVGNVRKHINTLFNGIELNLSCPNLDGKPIVSYDHNTAIAIIEEILADFPELTTGIKIAPHFSAEEEEQVMDQIHHYLQLHHPVYEVSFQNKQHFDRKHLSRLAVMLRQLGNRYPNLAYVSATNTMPNCRITKPDGATALHPKANGGQGGLSGEFLRPISLKNVATLKESLNGQIKVIGTGGVKDGPSAQQYFDSGADAVAVGTALINQGPRVFENIILDL